MLYLVHSPCLLILIDDNVIVIKDQSRVYLKSIDLRYKLTINQGCTKYLIFWDHNAFQNIFCE